MEQTLSKISKIVSALGLFCLLVVLAYVPAISQTADLVGKDAPEFKVAAHTGGELSLSQYTGKQIVVLAFYPKDFTGG